MSIYIFLSIEHCAAHLPYCIVRIISKFRIGSLVGSTSNSSMTTELTFLLESADSAFTAFMIFPWSETRGDKRESEREWANMKNCDQIEIECFCSILSRQRTKRNKLDCEVVFVINYWVASSLQWRWLNYSDEIELYCRKTVTHNILQRDDFFYNVINDNSGRCCLIFDSNTLLRHILLLNPSPVLHVPLERFAGCIWCHNPLI